MQIPVPKEMVNDNAYVLSALVAEAGQYVHAGDVLAELESSKASFSLISPGEGYFQPAFTPGDMVPVGASFGTLTENEESAPYPAAPKHQPQVQDKRFSRAAWDLLQKSGLSIDQFAGRTHIRQSDVQNALAMPPGAVMDIEALVMLGGGGHCRECIEAIEQAGVYRIYGVIDTYAEPGTLVAGYPVLGDNGRLEQLRKDGIFHLVLAYSIATSPAERLAHFRRLTALGHIFPAIVHPKAAVNKHAIVGAGAQIMPGAVVGSKAIIGDACIVNSNAVVSHDCELGGNVHVAPGALLAGGVRVGDNSVIGMGATVYMRTRIGANVVIYNGAAIFAEVPDDTVVRRSWPET